MTPTDIAAHVVAGCVAASRLITVVQPVWAKMPKWLAAVMPVLVLMLPQVADLAGVIKTQTDLLQFGIVSAALLLPGIAAAEIAAKKAAATTPSSKT